MKKSTFLLVLIITFIYSCKKYEINNTLIFSGKIENPTSDTLNILNKNQDLIKFILLNKNNTFRDTLTLPEGYYSLQNGNKITQIYLKPNFDLYLTLNTENYNKSIKFEGKGAEENNYLVQKTLLEQSFSELNYHGYYALLNEIDFLKLTDSLFNVQKKILDENINLDNDFYFIEFKSLEFRKFDKYLSFQGIKRIVTKNKDFEVSENYPNAFLTIDLSNDKLLISPDYLPYVQSYLRKRTREIINKNNENVDYYLEYVKIAKEEIKSNLIKQEILYSIGKWDLYYTKKIDSVFNLIKPALLNAEYLSEVTEKYEKIKNIKKGAISPIFKLKDINGKTIALNKLRGKLVYIDIWATWCSPCIKEIPSLKKLEAYFKGKDIQFVSICISDTEERWKKMVKDKELGGIQLFAPDEKISFLEDYSIQGIPRFILIDKDGKIIDGDAKQPSEPKLQEEIEKYL